MARFDKLELPGQPPNATAHSDQRKSRRADSDWLKQADSERRRGQYENALRYYSRALELDKSLVLGWLGQVQMLIQLDENVEAEVWSRKAIELFPGNGELLAGRAQALCRHGDLKTAHVLCDGSLQQSGQSAYRWMVRGELMLVGGQDVDRHCFDKARQINSDWLVPLEIALIYLHHKKPGRALDRARQAVEAGSDHHYAWYIQGLCEIELGLDTRAWKSLNRCLELCPGHVDAKQRIASVRHGGFSLFRSLRRLLGN